MEKMKNLILALMICWIANTHAQGSFGEIIGKIFEKSDSDLPAFGATVWVEFSGAKIADKVDEEGRFRISAIPVGTYTLKAIYMGEELTEELELTVKTDGIVNVGRINILEKIQMATEVVITGKSKEPLIDFGDVGIKRISAIDIALSPQRNDVGQLIASKNSEIKVDQNGDFIIRGSRAGDMLYFIDGVRTNEVKGVPSAAIGGMTIYTSAIPAKYGDTTGGVIILETKNYHEVWRERQVMKRKWEETQEKKKPN
jgi:hypothetical protein